nr:site-specific DNA-methyltransferase [Dehalococcoidales bacterium]
GNVWNIPMITGGKERVGYPTQKPLDLLERIISTSSNKDDTILDPFCGCGTAIIAAQQLGRHWIGIDMSKDAYNVSKDRYHQLSFESQFGQPEPQYIERNLDDVLAIDKPKGKDSFEEWVNGYFKAHKPNPDKGVDGITPDNIPIQTKTFVVKNYSYVTKLIGDARYHPQVKQPFDHAIIVSQKGFGDGARQRQFEIQTKEGIKVDLLTPAMMLNGYKELTP